ncbi:Rv1733c family protein [Rhodococcoides kyotonense]|uniref:Transmembrane protein n=1 Tax=Rhodococcoides kyotonense TaxID=398843 RepID=A0A239JWB2_9NOCA|nr:hypothetical protein [Rhodococcus kyotonensis]SNT10236.1 hypothetical protein SAMN05421642_109119 [Rhodococcus kyotonensis]
MGDWNTTLVVRWWRLAPWSGNALMRRGDRVVSFATILAVFTALLLIPIAAVFGVSTYSNLDAESVLERAEFHRIDAVVVDAPVPVEVPMDYGVVTSSYATASWTYRDGIVHTGRVRLPVDASQGQRVPVWVDDAGALARPPRTGTENAALGVCAALGFWSVATMVTLVGVAGVWVLARRSDSKQWAREWRRLERSS